MNTFSKIIIFILIFSFCFYLLNTYGQYINYNTETFIADVGGIGWLYSAIAVIFAFFAAFSMLVELERWQNLVESVKDEVNSLNELWLWSQYLPQNLKVKFDNDIKDYLKKIIEGGWERGEGLQKNIETDDILRSLHKTAFQTLKEKPDMVPSLFSTLSDIIKHREKRTHYLSFHLPKALKYTLIFNVVILIVFSLFIGMNNIYLQYLLVLSIAILSLVIYLLIEDLDNPTIFGGWHMTTNDYQDLLNKIESESSIKTKKL